jgi:hypothetical protein
MDLLNRFSSLQAYAAVGSVEGVNEGGRREFHASSAKFEFYSLTAKRT